MFSSHYLGSLQRKVVKKGCRLPRLENPIEDNFRKSSKKSRFGDISETQFGFLPDNGTKIAVFVARDLMETSVGVQKDLHLSFIDY